MSWTFGPSSWSRADFSAMTDELLPINGNLGVLARLTREIKALVFWAGAPSAPCGGLWWFNPRWQLSTPQSLAHSSPEGWGRESEE